MKKIIVLPMYGIGDVLMTTPALRNIKEQTGAKITYLHMFETTRDILLNNPCIDENIFFPFLSSGRLEGLRFLIKFRKRFDCSINFYPSNRRDYNLASFICGRPLRIGHRYARNDLTELNFLKNRTVMEDDTLHCVEENLRLLDFLGIRERKVYPMQIHLTAEEEAFASGWISDLELGRRRLIGIHPGTSVFKNQDRRRWPEVSFAKLIDSLSLEMDAAFLLFGGPDERPLRGKLISMVRTGTKIISVDLPSVRQAAALIRRCSLFISNDSGPMHIAAASGVPTVAVFGPTNPVWVRPWGVRHRVVRKDLPCSPCFRYSRKTLECVANGGYACIRDIAVEDVFEACLGIIQKV